MFGGKRGDGYTPQYDPSFTETDSRHVEFHYLVAEFASVEEFNDGVDYYAKKGWQLVNGCVSEKVHYAYLRRRFKFLEEPFSVLGAISSDPNFDP